MSQKGRRITPPLPSWKPIAPTEKENEPNLDRNRESRTVGKHNCAVPSTSRRSHVSGRLSGATTSRVVRFGESVESLFFLIDESSGEHRKICNDIANGDKADDPPSWRRVLEVASTSALSTSASLISTGKPNQWFEFFCIFDIYEVYYSVSSNNNSSVFTISTVIYLL